MPTAGTASRATGVVAMVLLTAVVVLGILASRRGRVPGVPRFTALNLHQFLSLTAVVFLAAHILTAVAIPFAHVKVVAAVVPFVSSYQPVWLGLGAVSLDLTVALVVTSLLRRQIGRRAWRAVHWLAYVCWPTALAHSIGTSRDMRSGRLLDLAVGCILTVLAAAGWRLTGPLRLSGAPRKSARSPRN